MDIVSLLIGIVIAGIGVAGFGVGGMSLWRWRQLGMSDPVPIRDAITNAGTVGIEGAVRPHDSTLESPHFGEECVAYEYMVEERRRRRSGNSGSRTTWRTIDSGQASRPFIVEDQSGRAFVDPEGASFSLESERTRKTNAQGEPVPDDSGWTLSVSVNLPGMGSVGVNNRRFTEKRLDVDGQCYVVGAAERPAAGIDADVSIIGDSASTFMVSDATEAETRRRLMLRGGGYAIAGLLVTVLGFGFVGTELL